MSPLGLLNAISPKDGSLRPLAVDIAYGADAAKARHLWPASAAGHATVLFFYGGSRESGDRADYAFVSRALAGLGYIAVVADYRLVPAVEYPVLLEDGAAIVGWIVRDIGAYGGDIARLALIGHFAGAYNAVMLALDPAYLRADGLLGYVRAVVGLSGPHDFFPFDIPISRHVFGAVADGWATQPLNLVAEKLSHRSF